MVSSNKAAPSKSCLKQQTRKQQQSIKVGFLIFTKEIDWLGLVSTEIRLQY
jgi:hypothetical protein